MSGRPLGTRVRRLLSRCSSLSLGRKDRLPFSMFRMWLWPRPSLEKVRQGGKNMQESEKRVLHVTLPQEFNCFFLTDYYHCKKVIIRQVRIKSHCSMTVTWSHKWSHSRCKRKTGVSQRKKERERTDNMMTRHSKKKWNKWWLNSQLNFSVLSWCHCHTVMPSWDTDPPWERYHLRSFRSIRSFYRG